MKKKTISQVKMYNSKPTTLNIKTLREWVVWQIPKKVENNGFCGAVHPPLAAHGWLPAIIYPEKNEAQVHAHLAQTFKTPELAAEHCLGFDSV